MMEAQTFTFSTQNPKASRYLLICLAAFVFIFGISFIPVVLMIVLVFGSMALGFILFNRHVKVLENISLYNDHLESEVFGTVYYEDIASAGPVTVDTGRGLKLKLKTGKKVFWLDVKKEERPVYDQFVSALSTAVSHLELPGDAADRQPKDISSEEKSATESMDNTERTATADESSQPDNTQNTFSEIGRELKNIPIPRSFILPQEMEKAR